MGSQSQETRSLCVTDTSPEKDDAGSDGFIIWVTESTLSPGTNCSKKRKEHGNCSDKLSDCKSGKYPRHFL